MKMQNTDIEFVTFDSGDVIATSGGDNLFWIEGLGNEINWDATITYNNIVIYNAKDVTTSLNPSDARVDSAKKALEQVINTTIKLNSTYFIISDKRKTTIKPLFNYNGEKDESMFDYNGAYEWINDHFNKVQ